MDESLYEIVEWIGKHGQEFMYFSYIVIIPSMFQNLIYLIAIPLAIMEVKAKFIPDKLTQTHWLRSSDITMPVSIFMPAYNESLIIIRTVKKALTIDYPEYELIVINDGSSDDSLEKLISEFELRPVFAKPEYLVPCEKIIQIYKSRIYKNLVVIDKENGNSKADALNAAINIAKYSIFCTVDADSVMEQSALMKTIQPFIENDEVIASGGTIRLLNGCIVEEGKVVSENTPDKLIAIFQMLEYMRAFIVGRMSFSRGGFLTIISGAFAILRRDIVIEVGGFNKNSIGEDYDLILSMHRYMMENNRPYQVTFLSEPVCWTQVPEKITDLSKQRVRWQQGALEGFFNNTDMLFRPKYGRIGCLALPISLVIDLIVPITELIGYILLPVLFYLEIIPSVTLFLYIAVFMVFGTFLSIIALILEELTSDKIADSKSIIKLVLIAIIENFGFRQLNGYWRLKGWYYFLRSKNEWNKLERSNVN